MKLKKVGVLSLSAALSLSVFSSQVSASDLPNQNKEKQIITIASVDSEVNKETLIKKLKQLFPGRFDFLTSKDFYFNTGHRYSEDDESIIRYNLSFNKDYDGKQVYGGIEFVGEELELQSFYYSPLDYKDAIFPAKVTEKKALEIAKEFLDSQFPNLSYQLNSDDLNYYPIPMNLTEPISYRFQFERLENDIPVMGQSTNVTVLGNGEITEVYSGDFQKSKATYDENNPILNAESALKKLKADLDVTLQYMVNYDYRGEETQVKLVYGVEPQVNAIHAKDGKWLVGREFTDKLPQLNNIKMLTNKPINTTAKPITENDAKEIAKKLLRPGNDDIKLRIQEVSEQENDYLGRSIYSVNYMYESRNSGNGASIEIDKNTGEVISFYDISDDVFGYDPSDKDKAGLTYTQAVAKALEKIKEFSPSIMHEYSYPINNELNKLEQDRDETFLTFPRVKNGIIVSGDSIQVSIKKDGSLRRYSVQSPVVKEWPSIDKAVAKEKALQDYLDQLDAKLAYTKVDYEKNHYSLVYFREFANQFHYYNAITGEWESQSYYTVDPGTSVEISHPTAEQELNYLIKAGIIKVDDPDTFNADAPLTKGKALDVLMKSIANYYELERVEYQDKETFSNIDKDHEYYSVIELAAQQKIIDTEQDTFSVDENISNEELAYWYIRALGLDLAAKHSDIYTLSFKDSDLIQKKYTGYVALANQLGLFNVKYKLFNPSHEVTLAELAVANIKLAKLIGETRSY